MKRLIAIVLWLLPLFASGQNYLKGKITDKSTGEALAFVNIVYNNRQQGTTTDLDGIFSIESREPIRYLIISYIGYIKDTIPGSEIAGKNFLNITLETSAETLDEVTVLPGINPAHRIIELVIGNRDINNPEKSTAFSYTSYNKLYATFDITSLPVVDTSTRLADTLILKTGAADTLPDSTVNSLYQAKQIADSLFFFLMESVSERKFSPPDHNKEVVIANRMSGLKNPLFFMLATQMQSFSFYTDLISVYDKKYLSPVSRGSTDKYFFQIEDTIFTENLDTVFVISFRPRKGKNFEGLKGVLYINSNRYAIQNVLAEPCQQSDVINISIQQKYEFIGKKQWFPVQLNTNFSFPTMTVSIDNFSMPLLGIGKSYISNIVLDPEFDKDSFDHIVISSEKNINNKPEEFWNKYRPDSLDFREKNTYHLLDSIGDAENLDEKVAFLEVLATGHIPLGFISFDLNRIMWYNRYEGYRLGLGIKTNDKVLSWASVGGYGAYGFRDKTFKYGGQLEFFPHKASALLIGFYYAKDVAIADYYRFPWSNSFIGTEAYNDLLVTEIDPIESYSACIEFRMLRYLKTRIYFSHTDKTILSDQRYFWGGFPQDTYGIPITDFVPDILTYTEAGVSGKLALKETFLQTPRGNTLSLGTNYPVLWFNLGVGIPLPHDNVSSYLKFQARISKKITTARFGETSVTITGGWASEHTPYSLLYKGPGTAGWLDVANTFNTMGVNEFISNRFVHLFLKHDFGSLLFRTKKWRPEIVLLTNLGWSDYTITGFLDPGTVHGYNKMYYESGLQINYMLRAMFIGYGFGVYYRYGAYYLPETIDNFAFKLTLTYSFE
ncbi:MAG TPA: DUF5686 family protein [Bacteroidales bacterium]|nr:DUF5686 family protein [Bacteroidales bacterium]